MKPRTAYLLQVIEKIGGPLLDAVTANTSKDQSGTISKEQAEHLAVLLAKSVQLSISLGKMIEIEKTEPELSDSLRVAMAGLASPIIASQYRHSSKVPSEDDMSKLGNALEAVMTFSDNFSPSSENAERLKNLQANGAPADIHQVNIQYIQAFVPVADVISRFPFGQAEKKMVQDAAEKITAKAKAMRQDIFGDIEDKDTQKFYELGIVKALADLYTHCHTHAVDKLMTLQEPDSDAQGKALSGLWDSFNIRAELLQTLGENLMPKGVKSAVSSGTSGGPNVAAPAAPSAPPLSPQPPEQQQATPVVAPAAPPAETTPQPQSAAPPPIFQKPPSEEPPAAPPANPPETQSQGQQAGGNPMSMFAKPKADTPPAAPPQAPPAAPPAEQQQQTPPPVAPAEQEPASEEQQQGGQQGGGGPMSFFKSPPKGEEEE